MSNKINGSEHDPARDHIDILRLIWKNKYWFFCAAILFFGLAIMYNKRVPPLYRSTVQLYIDAPTVAPEMASGIFEPSSNVVKRYYHEASSAGMLEHLIKKFDLGDHYKVPSNTPFRRQHLLDRLHGRIEVRMMEYQGLKVTVKDRDRVMAARLANEIYLELVRRNEQRANKELHKIQRLYQNVVDRLETRSRQEEKNTHAFLDSLTRFRSANGTRLSENEMFGLISMLAKNRQEGTRVRETQQFIASIAKKDNMPQILLVRRASYDIQKDPVLESVWRVGGITLGATSMLIFLVIGWHRYGVRFLAEIKEDLAEFPAPEPLHPVGLANGSLLAEQKGTEVPSTPLS